MKEKCNTNIEEGREAWEMVKADDFTKDVCKIKILDIGCGAGNAFFHFYVNPDFKTSDFVGIEMNCLHQIKGDYKAFKYYDIDDLLYWLDENRPTIDLYLYFQKLIEYEILIPDPKINEDKFKSLFMDKILWGTKIEESKFLEKTKDKFDLIILSNVLHFRDIVNPDLIIKNCENLLTEGGFIFIKSPIISNSNKRNRVNEEIVKKWTKNLKEHREIKNDKGFLYFLGTKKQLTKKSG